MKLIIGILANALLAIILYLAAWAASLAALELGIEDARVFNILFWLSGCLYSLYIWKD